MRRPTWFLRFPALLAILLSGVSPAAQETALVDWTRSEGAIERGLFSTQGFMQVYVEPNPMAMDSFLLTNPAGTHTRLETWIHMMEPANDNDDPNAFDWSAFHPQRSIRFIDDRDAFHAFLDSLEMEPLALVCYNAEWLKSGDADKPVRDHDEWAEAAAAIVESYNGRGDEYRPYLRLLEVWNEPNMHDFYTGTMESYFDLFERTADRIHRDYPGVMVGGPAISHAWHTSPEEWMQAFLKGPAAKADFISYHHYGPQGESVGVLEEHLTERVRAFRSIPGRENGRAMITEIDAWFDGWPKVQHILERQFMFLRHSDLLLSVHQFCCLAYNESGNYTFGIVDRDGGTIEGTFRPYWLFRNLIGERSHLAMPDGTEGIGAIASRDERDTGTLHSALFHNATAEPASLPVALRFDPSESDRVLAWNSLRENGFGVRRVERVAAGAERLDVVLDLRPGEAVALNLFESGRRHFAFRDINNQVHPWIGASADAETVAYGGTLRVTAEILNTTFEPVAGTLEVGGLPGGWTATTVAGNPRIEGLAFGESAAAAFEIDARTMVPGSFAAPFVYLRSGATDFSEPDSFAHSVPLRIRQEEPFAVSVLPNPIYATVGETVGIMVQIDNFGDTDIDATTSLLRPAGALEGPDRIAVEPGERTRATYRYATAEPIDEYLASASPMHTVLEFAVLGETIRRPVDIHFEARLLRHDALTVDLSEHLNHDPTTFMTDRADFDQELMGMFSFPADSLPSATTAFSRGVPFRFADMGEGADNAVLPQGQAITLPNVAAEGVVLLGFGHDGAHPGTFAIGYADGSEETFDSRIPEWCTPPPPGFEVAFRAPHRHVPGGVSGPPCELFMWTLETDASKSVETLELPTMENAYLFAVTVLPAK